MISFEPQAVEFGPEVALWFALGDDRIGATNCTRWPAKLRRGLRCRRTRLALSGPSEMYGEFDGANSGGKSWLVAQSPGKRG